MTLPGIHLQYRYDTTGQQGSDIENPLYSVLAAMQAHGSIRHAAKSLGLSYRHVWGSLKQWEEQLGQPLVQWVQGRPAQLTPYGQRLMWAERQARTRLTPHVEALRAELRHVLEQAAQGGVESVDMLASHDLALPRLQALAAPRRVHLSLRFAGSEDSLRGLNRQQCLLAGFHVPHLPQGSSLFARALRPLLKPGTHKLIGSHRRVQGLMYPKALGQLPNLAAVAERGLRWVNRQRGSGTRLLQAHLMRQEGLVAPAPADALARVENTHVALAACIAAGAADVGLGLEAAAAEFGLAFTPLAEEAYYLVCLKGHLEGVGIERVRDTLVSRAWSQALGSLAGCRPHAPGEVLSLTQALPWWSFGTRKAEAGVQAGTRSPR